jgi:hypothetical protein
MAWKRGYYYRVRKVGGRVVREYVGTGRVAELAAQLDAIERETREAEAAAWRAEKARLEALDADVAALIEVTDLAAAAALLAAGYHQHKRQWRRKRRDNSNRPDGADGSAGVDEDTRARPAGG